MPATTLDDRWGIAFAERGRSESDAISVASSADALEAALRVRAPALHAGTPLVRKLARRVSRGLGLDESETRIVDACAQLRDVGMLGLSDSVILNTATFSPGDGVDLTPAT